LGANICGHFFLSVSCASLPLNSSFYFFMKSIFRTIVHNSFFRTIIEGTKAVSGIVLVIFLARAIGPGEYGRLAFAFALTGLASIVMNLGLSITFIRDGARDINFLKNNIATALLLQLIASLIVFLMLIGALFLFPVLRQDALLLIVALFYTMFSIITNFLYGSFQATHRMHLEAIAVGTQHLLLITFVLFFVFYRGTTEAIMFGYLGASVLGGLLTFFLVRKYLFSWVWQINWGTGKVLLMQSWPLMAGSALSTIYFSLDSVMLRFFQGSEAVGIYSAMYKIIFAFYLFATLYGTSIFPVLSQLFTHARDQFINLYDRSVQLMTSLGLLFGLIITLFATPLIQIFFGKEYLGGVLTLQISIWSIMIFLVGLILYDTLIVAERQKALLWSVLASTILNAIFNIILIPIWSIAGAAIATVIAQVAQLLFNIYLLKTIVPSNFLFLIVRPFFMAGISVALFFLFSIVLPVFGAATIAVVVYVLLLFVAKILHVQELNQMMHILTKKKALETN